MEESSKNNKTCSRCGVNFIFRPEETWFDDKGYGYSTKLVRCPHCGQINIIKHIEDRAMKKLNRNGWEY